MESIFEIKKRINSINAIKKITKAMLLISTLRFKQAEQMIKRKSDYFKIINEMVSNIYENMEAKVYNKIFSKDHLKVKKVLYIICTSDLGFCGGFNNNVIKSLLADFNNAKDAVISFGNKGESILKKYNIHCKYKFNLLKKNDTFEALVIPNIMIYNEFLHNNYTKLVVIYNKFVSIMKINVAKVTLWPFKFKNNRNVKLDLFQPADIKSKDNIKIPFIYEPNLESVAREIFPNYLSIVIYGCLIYSFVSENAMRQVAMDNATNNAIDIINDLTTQFNKIRQYSITNEILEIINGAQG